MPTFSTTRAAAVLVVLNGCFVALIGRVAYLQTYGRQQTIRLADREHHQTEIIPARRGSIFDRQGLEMAGTVQTQTLFVDPKFMEQVFTQDGRGLVEMDQSIARLAKVVDRDPYEVSQLLSDRLESRFVKLAENLDESTCERILKMKLPGVGLVPANERYYPMGSLAAHVLGGTGTDGKGLEGLELRFEKTLAGKSGYERLLKDAGHRPIGLAAEDYLAPQHGQHLILTLDANIQMIAEQELAATCDQFRAKRGEVIVMDPRTGEVLALANWPTFNPQNLGDSTPEARRDNCLVSPYEPGSTLKPFMVGPALAWRVTRLNEIWPIPGIRYKTPYGRTITDVHAYGPLPTWDGVVKSSNILMSMLAERMTNPRLHRAMSSWRFGEATGIELPGEDRGKLNALPLWNKFSTESIAQGYEIMVTPVQLCRAFSAYANGGRLVQPTLIKGVLDPDGRIVSRTKPGDLKLMPQVLDPVIAAEMKRVLCDVLVRGTASKARSETYTIFGKTGTAHISEGKSGYSATRYNSSFIAGAPAEDPRLTVAFIVHDPDIDYAREHNLSHYGGAVAAPGASKLLERALTYLQVPASPDLAPPPPHIASVLVNYDPKVYKKRPGSTASARD